MRLDDKWIHLVQNSLDISICNTGYPVTAQVLKQAGLADRKQLRHLEKHGYIHAVNIYVPNERGTGQQYKAYYTANELPKQFMRDYGFKADATGALVPLEHEQLTFDI